jgi:thiol-disulfide isomerase/thioredoxin
MVMGIDRSYRFTILATILLSFSVCAFSSTQQKSKKHPQKKIENAANVNANYGKYEFSFRTLDGKTIHLSDYSGKTVLVNIWAPWCSPCKTETPGIVRLYERYHKKGLEILGVAVQTNESDVRSFMLKYKVQWRVGIKDEIAKIYGTYGIPDSYLFRSDGSLIKEFTGFASEEALEPLIQEALNFSK